MKKYMVGLLSLAFMLGWCVYIHAADQALPPEPLFDVWGSSGSNVFAVGGHGTILRYDGKQWSPMFSGVSVWLAGIWGSADNDVFAVGDQGAILHYDGSRWTIMESGTSEEFKAIWGNSGSDVFAVGDHGTILHYDGSQWIPLTSGTSASLYGVWGSSGSNVFAVGADGSVLHYDGASWAVMASNTSARLIGVWGSSDRDVFVAGSLGLSKFAPILRYDGSHWTAMAHDAPEACADVWGNSGSDVLAVGDHGMIMRYDGMQWTKMASGTTAGLFGVWGSSGSDIFVVGENSTILRYDGTQWTSMTSPAEMMTESGAYIVGGLVFTPDGKKLLGSTGKETLTWDWQSKKLLHVTSEALFAVADDSETFLTRTPEGFHAWETETGRNLQLKKVKPDSYGRFKRSWIAVDRHNMIFTINDAFNVYRPVVIKAAQENSAINRWVLSPYGYLIVIFDFESHGHDTTFGICFDMDGKEYFRFYANRFGSPVVAVTEFFPFLAVENSERSMGIYELPNGGFIKEVDYPHDYGYKTREYVRFGPQSKLTVAANRSWNSFRITPHTIRDGVVTEAALIQDVAFHPGGQQIVSALLNGEIRIYNLETLELETILKPE